MLHLHLRGVIRRPADRGADRFGPGFRKRDRIFPGESEQRLVSSSGVVSAAPAERLETMETAHTHTGAINTRGEPLPLPDERGRGRSIQATPITREESGAYRLIEDLDGVGGQGDGGRRRGQRRRRRAAVRLGQLAVRHLLVVVIARDHATLRHEHGNTVHAAARRAAPGARRRIVLHRLHGHCTRFPCSRNTRHELTASQTRQPSIPSLESTRASISEFHGTSLRLQPIFKIVGVSRRCHERPIHLDRVIKVTKSNVPIDNRANSVKRPMTGRDGERATRASDVARLHRPPSGVRGASKAKRKFFSEYRCCRYTPRFSSLFSRLSFACFLLLVERGARCRAYGAETGGKLSSSCGPAGRFITPPD